MCLEKGIASSHAKDQLRGNVLAKGSGTSEPNSHEATSSLDAGISSDEESDCGADVNHGACETRRGRLDDDRKERNSAAC